MDGIVHWDDVEPKFRGVGDIGGRWRFLGNAVGTKRAGVRRFELEPGMRSTAVHVHGAEEEIFFILGGHGLVWQDGTTCEIGEGDCIVHRPGREAHTLRAGASGLDALVFSSRVATEVCYLPRAQYAFAGPTVVAAPGRRNLWEDDVAAGPMEFSPPTPPSENVASLTDVPAVERRRGDSRSSWRDLGRACGSVDVGLRYVTVEPGFLACPPHCHSSEEEIFVILAGEGTCLLGDSAHPVRAGHVVARPAGTRVAHAFRGGGAGLRYLAFGSRDPNDIVYYPRSRKVFLRGVGVIGRIEALDYWDGEDG